MLAKGVRLTFSIKALVHSGSRSQPQPQPSSQTDFNSFLVDVTKPPQGTQKQKLQPNLQQPAAASFDAFLKERKPALVATEFDAFLKDQEVSELHEEESPAAAPDSNPKEDQVQAPCQVQVYPEMHQARKPAPALNPPWCIL